MRVRTFAALLLGVIAATAVADAPPAPPESDPAPVLPEDLPLADDLPPSSERAPLPLASTPQARALDAFIREALECAAVFHIGALVGRRSGDQQTYDQGTQASRFAVRIALTFGPPDAVQAGLTDAFIEQAKYMNGRDANWPAVWERHERACKQLVGDPRARLLHWLEQGDGD